MCECGSSDCWECNFFEDRFCGAGCGFFGAANSPRNSVDSGVEEDDSPAKRPCPDLGIGDDDEGPSAQEVFLAAQSRLQAAEDPSHYLPQVSEEASYFPHAKRVQPYNLGEARGPVLSPEPQVSCWSK